jgi:hypothetical protein
MSFASIRKSRYALHDRLAIRFRKNFSIMGLALVSALPRVFVLIGGKSGQ